MGKSKRNSRTYSREDSPCQGENDAFDSEVVDGAEKETPTPKRLDEHTVSYFVRIHEVIKDKNNKFDDEESKKLFFNNIFRQVKEDFVRLSKNWKVSRVLEDLMHFFDNSQLRSLFEIASEFVLHIVTDKFASHVLQRLLGTVQFYGDKQHSSEDSKHTRMLLTTMIKSKILDNMSTLVRDVYGSHVISEIFQVLAGVRVDPKLSRSKGSIRYQKKNISDSTKQHIVNADSGITNVSKSTKIGVSKSFLSVLDQMIDRILMVENFGELLCNRSSSPVLQIALLVASKHNQSKCIEICDKILLKGNMKAVDPYDFSVSARAQLLFVDDVGSHLVEVLLSVVSPEQHKQTFELCFKNHLLTLSLDPRGNFLVQALFKTFHFKEDVEAAISELLGSIDKILHKGHPQVIVHLASASVKFAVLEDSLSATLIKMFNNDGESDKSSLIKNIILMKMDNLPESVEKHENDVTKVPCLTAKYISYHGCCLAKSLLMFHHPKKVAKCFSRLTTDDFIVLCCHQYGSMVAEVFFQSGDVDSKTKMKVFSKFLDCVTILVCDRFGSHVCDKVWTSLDVQEKETIVKKLLAVENEMRHSFFGKFAIKNYGLNEYKANKKLWREKQTHIVQVQEDKNDRGEETIIIKQLNVTKEPHGDTKVTDATMDKKTSKRKKLATKEEPKIKLHDDTISLPKKAKKKKSD